tara:strand:- start:530 stop:1207 length:678 start_codon:yes stop_codon:yes gene_type:complete
VSNSYIFWRGPSPYDGAPLIAGVTGVDLSNLSRNRKTGAMAQVWILREDMPPVEAHRQNLDGSTCGDCSLRWNNSGGCYVTVCHMTPMWRKLVNEGVEITPRQLGNKCQKNHVPIRLGAFGDPANVPLQVWEELGVQPKGSGYTHQWEWADVQFAELVMASVETLEKKEEANAKGYRTFRILLKAADVAADEVLCPNYTRGTQCRTCGLCGGLRSKAKNVAIPMH